MPIYEYECESCGKVIEKWQKITEPPLKTCEHCGGKVHKLVSMSSFHLKGSGWYVTDYAKKSTKDDKKDASSDTKDTKDKGTTSSKSNDKGASSQLSDKKAGE